MASIGLEHGLHLFALYSCIEADCKPHDGGLEQKIIHIGANTSQKLTVTVSAMGASDLKQRLILRI